MPSIPQKDRVSLCRYTFSDHRQCRTPRSPSHPHFCFYHARLESQSASAAKLADDIEFFFSGKYVSANDLSKVLARILPAIIRGNIKPRLAKTIVYLAQTFNQTIQLAQQEYIGTYGPNAWRTIIDTNITLNSKFDNAPANQENDAEPADPEDSVPHHQPDESPVPAACHPERSEGPASSSSGEVEADSEPAVEEVADPPISSSESRTSQISHPERSEGLAFSSAPIAPHSPTAESPSPL